MATGAWELTKDTVKGFIADEALSHGARSPTTRCLPSHLCC